MHVRVHACLSTNTPPLPDPAKFAHPPLQVPPAYPLSSVEIREEDSFASVPRYPLTSMDFGAQHACNHQPQATRKCSCVPGCMHAAARCTPWLLLRACMPAWHPEVHLHACMSVCNPLNKCTSVCNFLNTCMHACWNGVYLPACKQQCAYAPS